MLLKCSKEKSHCSSHLSRMLVKACVQYVDFDEYTCTQTHRPTTARALCAQPTHPNACTHTHTHTHTHTDTHRQCKILRERPGVPMLSQHAHCGRHITLIMCEGSGPLGLPDAERVLQTRSVHG